MIVWDDARYLLAVHRAGSLSAAAKQLGVNQSTVSRRLAFAEQSFAARFFARTPDGYVLTPAGERAIAHAERMEDEAVALERELTGQGERLTGAVRITGPDVFSAVVLVPLIGELSSTYPEIEFELVADDRTMSLSKREADIALRTARPRESHVVGRKICDFAYGLYASHAYFEAHGTPRPPDFEGHRFVAFDEARGPVHETRYFAVKAKKAKVALRASSTPTHEAAAAAGIGLAILPCYLGDTNPALVRIGGTLDESKRELWLVLHRDLQHAARFRACADFLVAALGREAARFRGTRRRR